MNAVATIQPAGNVEAYRASTDAAQICKDIVVATASNIQGKKYVCVEGWMAIAVAHGCAASARDVEKVDGGVRAVGEIRRMSDGALISVAEGFVGEDEPTWYGGLSRGKMLPKRADYAIRAMAQTRAISRAGRSAFAHVVVMMNAGLATTPAEEVPFEGFNDEPAAAAKPAERARPTTVENGKTKHITDTQRAELMSLASAKNIDAKTLCEVGGIRSIPEMPAEMFDHCKRWLAKQAARPLGTPTQAAGADILDDEIPY